MITYSARRRGLYAVLLTGLIGLVTAGVAVAADPAPTETVLAPGDPPLTREGLDRFTYFVEWLLDVPLTQQQKQLVATSFVEAWEKQDAEEIQGYVDTLDLEAQVSALPKEDRLLVREQVQPQVLELLRNQPNDEGARWLLGIYEAGHQPLAEGNPPLTRQMADAYVELMCFMLSEVIGEPLPASPELRDALAASLKASYPQLTAEEQAEYAQMPLLWAAYQAAWPELPEEEKETQRRQWAETLRPQVEQARAAAQAEPKPEPEPAAEPKTAAEVQQDLMQRQAALAANQQYFNMMQNVMQSTNNTFRVINSNFGGNTRYEYRY
jgi:hypothetical protein